MSTAGFAVSSSNAAKSVRCRALVGKSWFALRWPKIKNLSVFAPLQFVLIVLVQAFGEIEISTMHLFHLWVIRL